MVDAYFLKRNRLLMHFVPTEACAKATNATT